MTSALASVVMPSSKELQGVQRTRKWLLLLLFGSTLVPILFTDSYWHERGSPMYGLIEGGGVVLLLACIFGRTWCSLYIGGRKKRELVTVGPYSLVRNPLYVFTLLGAFGIGAQLGSLVVATWFAVVAFIVFYNVVRKEEQYLAAEFPVEFRAYAAAVPRFWPSFSAWRDVEDLVVKPVLIRRTFLEACLLLLSIPAADLLDMLQRHDVIAVRLLLP